MIRNRTLFYVALVGAALMVLRRHAIRVEDALDMPGALMSALPDTKISLAVTIVFIGLSLFPFGGRSADKNNARRRPAGPRFVKDDLVTIAERIRDLTKGPKPDVPFIVDYLIYQGKAAGASDIHFDPSKYGFTIRFRVDGMMQDVAFVPESITNPVSNRLKVISNLVVYQGYLPQDGRLATDREGGSGEDRQKEQATADFRIAFMPTMHGERIVIRILGVADDKNFEFTSLGMSEAQEQLISRFIEEPQGMIVLTGPTGSGKTTTIYTALRAIQDKSRGQRSIATLEDPIEYEISGINQSQVDNKKDFTFDKGLRALLRQDPDVIMVGEIRDSETAKIAIQSGMTGHLIITTVHANSSSATFSRLLEMGVAPHALNTSVTAVISQRLVRRICPDCKDGRQITRQEMDALLPQVVPGDMLVYEGAGCGGCNGTGYQGRHAIYEILGVTDQIQALLSKEAPAETIYNEAIKQGMVSLFSAGIESIKKGNTTVEEITRALYKDRRS